jgi:hypothetical protein
MKTCIINFVCAAILPVSVMISCNEQSELMVFKPVIYEKGQLIEQNEVEAEFYENLKVVLDYFDVQYVYEKQIIYVSKVMYNDKELLMNFTSKARNKDWISQSKRKLKNSQE